DGHRLAGSEVRLADLADEPFVLGHHNTWQTYRPIIDRICIRAGFMPKVIQEASTSEAVLGLVSSGVGVTLYLRQHGEWPGVTYVDLADCDAPIETLLIWRRKQISPIVGQFLKMAKQMSPGHAPTEP